jgi:hypothetical protein
MAAAADFLVEDHRCCRRRARKASLVLSPLSTTVRFS